VGACADTGEGRRPGNARRDPVSGGHESCVIIAIRAQAKGSRGGGKASRSAGRVSREVVRIDGPSDQGDHIKVSIMSSGGVAALLANHSLERTRHTAAAPLSLMALCVVGG
jgi:hypothetical protein